MATSDGASVEFRVNALATDTRIDVWVGGVDAGVAFTVSGLTDLIVDAADALREANVEAYRALLRRAMLADPQITRQYGLSWTPTETDEAPFKDPTGFPDRLDAVKNNGIDPLVLIAAAISHQAGVHPTAVLRTARDYMTGSVESID